MREDTSADLAFHFFPSGHGGPGSSEPKPLIEQPPVRSSAADKFYDPFESPPPDQPTIVTVQSQSVGEEGYLRLFENVVKCNHCDSRKALLRLPEHLRAQAKQARIAHQAAFLANRPQRQSAKDRNGRGHDQRWNAQTSKRRFGG